MMADEKRKSSVSDLVVDIDIAAFEADMKQCEEEAKKFSEQMAKAIGRLVQEVVRQELKELVKFGDFNKAYDLVKRADNERK